MSSIKKRYSFTVISMVLKSGISFLTTIFIARELGVRDYGDYAFIISTFMSIRQLTDLGASSAFYNFISRSDSPGKLIRAYISWVILQFIFIALILCLCPEQWLYKLWMHEDRSILILAYMATFMQGSLWLMATQIAESRRLTVYSQSTNLVVVIINGLLVSLLWYHDKFGIYSLIVVAAIEWFIASLFLIHISVRGINNLNKDSINFTTFFKYIKPLILYTIIGCLAEFCDRWMLQNWFGGSQQGGLAIALQISTLILILTTSSIQIFWKELAEYHQGSNYEEIIKLYSKTSKVLFLISAITSSIILAWSREILTIFLGFGYEEQSLTLILIIIYTLLLSLYQLSSVVLYAIGKTVVHVSIGLILRVAGVFLSFIVLSPYNFFDIGFSGSEKLSIKMILIQILMTILEGMAVNYYLKIGSNYKYYIKTFISILIIFNIIKYIMINIFDNQLISISISFFVYTFILVFIFINKNKILNLKNS